ncbi:type II secretion system protein [Hutsoniella sourekii]|uniref:type II secretion system protein n=1 Tax=Hutsoniella sourekii TaxID=87650 RepID=UPI00048695B3|nr:type II secretion system protein [Hutsoniella sourekii]
MNKKGFSLVESLLGLFVFSFIVSFYLPAFYQQMHRLSQIKLATDQWRLFQQLTSLGAEGPASEIGALMRQSFEDRTGQEVVYYDYQAGGAVIAFSDGQVLEVVLSEVE